MSEQLGFEPEEAEIFKVSQVAESPKVGGLDEDHNVTGEKNNYTPIPDKLDNEVAPHLQEKLVEDDEQTSDPLSEEFNRIMSLSRNELNYYSTSDGAAPIRRSPYLTPWNWQIRKQIKHFGWDEVFTKSFANILTRAREDERDSESVKRTCNNLFDELANVSSTPRLRDLIVRGGIEASLTEDERRHSIIDHARTLLKLAINQENEQRRQLLRPADPPESEILLRPHEATSGNENPDELLIASQEPKENDGAES